jgi:two-component system phosphate regulon sensor histidine kinase PhoR
VSAFWPYLAVLAILGLVLHQLWWRRHHFRLRQQHARELESLRAESGAAAARAESRQRALFDSMVEGLLLLDTTGRVQLANRRVVEFFNLGSDVTGRTALEATRSHELAELADAATRAGELTSRTLRLPGSPERHVEVNAAPILSAGGRQEGLLLVLHDVSRLRQLENTRQEFVANVSHELRTPLSLIKGYAETLLDPSDKDEAVTQKFLQSIDRNARRLQFLIEDLLAISALESGRVQMDFQSLDLQEQVAAVVEDYQPAATARGVRIRTRVPKVNVRADEERLHQVFGNLIDNAVKYGRPDGHVDLTARLLPEGRVEVCVGDDGPGIPSEALGRIFERFYRVDRARSRDQGGTGLGLSIVKHIVQAYGGTVWAESELGKGTRVFFTLPAAA